MSKVKRVPPNIEKISEFEVYLLTDDGDRIKRICGQPRPGVPDEFCCLNDAGKGTTHPGSGPCIEHEARVQVRGFLDQGREDYPQSLRDAIDRVGDLNASQLSDLDGDIQIYYVLLQSLLGMTSSLTSAQIDLASKLADKIINAKKTKYQLQKSVSLDVKLIKQFLQQIIAIIRRNVDEPIANRIFSEIISQVVLPMQRKDLISGDIQELNE